MCGPRPHSFHSFIHSLKSPPHQWLWGGGAFLHFRQTTLWLGQSLFFGGGNRFSRSVSKSITCVCGISSQHSINQSINLSVLSSGKEENLSLSLSLWSSSLLSALSIALSLKRTCAGSLVSSTPRSCTGYSAAWMGRHTLCTVSSSLCRDNRRY